MSGRRILLVDAEPAGMMACLEAMGDSVDIARDGLAGIQALYAEPDCFDLIVINAHLPGISGWDVLRAIRQDWCCADVKVLMLIQEAHEAAYAKGMARGAEEYLLAPFTGETFLAYVDVLTAQAIHMSFVDDEPTQFRSSELAFSAVE